jgi:hypothetical protein
MSKYINNPSCGDADVLVASRHLLLLCPRALQQCLGEICQLLGRCLEDGYHEIKKASCTALTVLAGRVGPAAMEPYTEKLLQVFHARQCFACGMWHLELSEGLQTVILILAHRYINR